MALTDTLSQMTWAMMQDWMNKRQQEAALETLAKQQQGWSEYQREGNALELSRIKAATEAQQLAAVFEKLLGLPEKDDPSALRAMKIIEALRPGSTKSLMGLVPGMEAGGELITSQMPQILAGNLGAVKGGDMASAMGGIDRLMRLLELGGQLENTRMQLPVRAANAKANLAGAETGGGGGSGVLDRQQKERLSDIIRTTKTEVSKIAAKFTGVGSQSNFDAMLASVASIMPPEVLSGMEESSRRSYVQQWVKEVGPEFFGKLNKQLQEIHIRFNTPGGELTDNEMAFLRDAADVYGIAETFRAERLQMIDALQTELDRKWAEANNQGTAPRIQDIMDETGTDGKPTARALAMKNKIYQDTWNMLYGGGQ